MGGWRSDSTTVSSVDAERVERCFDQFAPSNPLPVGESGALIGFTIDFPIADELEMVIARGESPKL